MLLILCVHCSVVAHKQREERQVVSLPTRLRGDHGWCDATIANVSSRGLQLRCPSPPPRSSFVELRHRGITIVGRVVWSQGGRAGIRTQDKIDIQALLAQGPARARKRGEERRATPRQGGQAIRPSLAARAEASARWARMFDWTIVAAAGIAAAVGVAGVVQSVLEAPLSEVRAALGD